MITDQSSAPLNEEHTSMVLGLVIGNLSGSKRCQALSPRQQLIVVHPHAHQRYAVGGDVGLHEVQQLFRTVLANHVLGRIQRAPQGVSEGSLVQQVIHPWWKQVNANVGHRLETPPPHLVLHDHYNCL